MNNGIHGLPNPLPDHSWVLPVTLPRDGRVGASAFQPLTRFSGTMSSKSMSGSVYISFTPARFLFPVYLQDVTIEVTTSAASTSVLLSLYEPGPDLLPGKLYRHGLASFDATSTGVKTVVVGAEIPNRPLYWATQCIGPNTPFLRGWTQSGYAEHVYMPQTDTIASAGRGSLQGRIAAGETPHDMGGYFSRTYGSNPGWELGNPNPFISVRGWRL